MSVDTALIVKKLMASFNNIRRDFHMIKQICLALAAAAALSSAAGDLVVKPFGFANVDYGTGNDPVFNDTAGNDALGTAKLALGTKVTQDNLTLVAVIGAGASTFGNLTDAIAIRDAFIDWSKIAGTGLGASFGAQPFLFGLKANGFPGDRSIRGSVEFGGGGAKAVSQQAGPSIKLRYEMMDKVTVTVATFDNGNGNAGGAGSGIANNQFADIAFHDLGVAGLYGFAGFERAYLGGPIDDSKPIMDGGLGFKMAMFDVSAEYIRMDKDWAGTADDESYIVTELTVTPVQAATLYADYSRADQLDVSTVRAGVTYQSHPALTWVLEYSVDLPNGAKENPMAVIARAHFGF
jgi:hypothetical protein